MIASAPGTYALRRPVIGSSHFVPLSGEECNALKAAHSILNESVEIEEKYNLVIGNFFDFEKFVLNRTVEYELWHSIDYAGIQVLTAEINRHVLNLLSGCRLYQDTKFGSLERMLNSEAAVDDVRTFASQIYDASLPYRFCEALRNHVQHSAMDVRRITLAMAWIDLEQKKGAPPTHLRRVGASLPINAESLNSNKKFKQSVLKEISSLPSEPDLKLYLREYIDGIKRIHERIRKLSEKVVTDSDNLIDKHLSSYAKVDTTVKNPTLAVVKCGDHGTYEICFYLFRDRIDYWKELRAKNSTAGRFSEAYITSESLP